MVQQMSLFSIVVAAMLIVASAGWGAEVAVSEQGQDLILHWQGDESIEVTLPATGGLWGEAFRIAVGEQQLTFDGFHAAVNGKPIGEFRVLEQSSRTESKSAIYEQVLKHPDLEQPTSVRIVVSMDPEDKAIRFEIALQGPGQHLDDLGLGRCHGEGLGAKRLYFGTCVINGPIKSFSAGPRYSTNRYWTWELANGLSLMQGTDMLPHRYVYEAGDQSALFNLRTYSSVPITYRFVVTAKGGQEALRQYSRSLGHQPTAAVKKLPGRCVFMAWYPIKDHLEWWYRQLVGRGARRFIWLTYTNRPSNVDRRILDSSDSLYCAYTNYIDYFDPVAEDGKRSSPDWAPQNCVYRANGSLVRGYHRSTRLLPNLYEKWATKGHMSKVFYNLREHVEIMGVNAWYFDVHAAISPHPYFDHQGNRHSQRQWWQYTADLFALARKLGGDAPVFSEFGREWYAEAMDGGAFNQTNNMENYGIQGTDWAHYPNVEHIHRRWHLPVSVSNHVEWERFREPGQRRAYFQERAQLNVFFGRPEMISCYWDNDLSDMLSRLKAYYIHSAFHKMLGNNGIHQVDFFEGDIHRPVVHYDHGATAWVNRRRDDRIWEVEGLRLSPGIGYLVRGPGLEQYCTLADGGYDVEYVRSRDYWLFAAPRMHDFGTGKVNGVYAVRVPRANKIVVYQVRKTSDVISLHLPALLGREGPWRVQRLVNVMPDRRIERHAERYRVVVESNRGTEITNAYEVQPTRIEDGWLTFEPAQDPNVLRYEIELAGGEAGPDLEGAMAPDDGG